ncbi:hypothetical protein KT71_09132 [Congregibacter litoralis KT71]|uniref:Uncharacterized protein n=1 Tax=Congregibacter litoralis KT71 TaxID=314285 RepID=A4A4Q7_9GAMM|nr:hypothetical protein KT71_09132 [Congregibacter litoralis KT71]
MYPLLRVAAACTFLALVACGGGGGGGASNPATPPAFAPAPSPSTTTDIDDLLAVVSFFRTSSIGQNYALRIELKNQGQSQFIGNQDAEWAVFLGPHINAVPRQDLSPMRVDTRSPVLIDTLSSITVESNASTRIDTDLRSRDLDNGTYIRVCLTIEGEPILDTCSEVFQYRENISVPYVTGSEVASREIGVDGRYGSATLDVLARRLDPFLVANFYLSENAPDIQFAIADGVYRAFVYDATTSDFAPGLPGDIISDVALTDLDSADFFGEPEGGVWRALQAAKPETYDPNNTSLARFFGENVSAPSRIGICLITNPSNVIVACSEELEEGFVGPPICSEGFIQVGTETENMMACQNVSPPQGGLCLAQFQGATLFSESDTVLEIGATLSTVGCSGDTTINVAVPFALADGTVTITGVVCAEEDAPWACTIVSPSDGMYDLRIAAPQCAIGSSASTLFAETEGRTLDALALSGFCSGTTTPPSTSLEIVPPCELPCAYTEFAIDNEPSFTRPDGAVFDTDSLDFSLDEASGLVRASVGVYWTGPRCGEGSPPQPTDTCTLNITLLDVSNGTSETRFGVDNTADKCGDARCVPVVLTGAQTVFTTRELNCSSTYVLEMQQARADAPMADAELLAALLFETPACDKL